MGLVASLQRQDTGLIPSSTQCVKVTGVALTPGLGTPYTMGWPKMKKKNYIDVSSIILVHLHLANVLHTYHVSGIVLGPSNTELIQYSLLKSY